jgi:hypothetical protein
MASFRVSSTTTVAAAISGDWPQMKKYKQRVIVQYSWLNWG